MSDVQRSQLYQSRLLQFGGGIARWFIRQLFPPAVGSDGAVHVFVATSGNDLLNTGLSASSALRTFQAGCDLACAYHAENLSVDVVLEIAAGTYTEDVVLNVPIAMKRRLVVRGPRDAMTVVASGVAGAGTNNYQITDPTAVLGAGGNRGLLLHMFDPLNRAATEQWRTIQDNSVTSIFFPEPSNNVLGPVAAPGWTWEIVRPAAILVGAVGGGNAALDVIMPWSSELAPSVQQNEIPSVVLQWLQINNSDGGTQPSSVRCQGGTLGILGCVFEGATGGLYLKNATFWSGGDIGATPDLVLQALTLTMLVNACLGTKPTGANAGVRMENSRAFFETLVSAAIGGVVCDRQSELQWVSGACYTGVLGVQRGSIVVGLGSGAAAANTPLLFSGQAAGVAPNGNPAINTALDCTINIEGPVHFGVPPSGAPPAPAGGCMRSNNESLIRLPGRVDGATAAIAATSFVTTAGALLTPLDAQNRGGIQTSKETGLSVVTGRGGTYPLPGGGTLDLTINGVGPVSVVLGAGLSLAAVAAAINAAVGIFPAVPAFSVGGELQLRSYTPALAYPAAGFGAAGSVAILATSTASLLVELGLVVGATTNGLFGTGATPECRADALGGTLAALTVAAPLVGPNSDARLWRQQNVI